MRGTSIPRVFHTIAPPGMAGRNPLAVHTEAGPNLAAFYPQISLRTPNFFDPSKHSYAVKHIIALNELEVRQFERMFANSSWDGGEHWGSISFDVSGRRATYTNNPGRSPGTILIQGAPPGTVPIIIGEWFQKDKQEGKLIMGVDSFNNPTKLEVSWGPGFTEKTLWKRKN